MSVENAIGYIPRFPHIKVETAKTHMGMYQTTAWTLFRLKRDGKWYLSLGKEISEHQNPEESKDAVRRLVVNVYEFMHLGKVVDFVNFEGFKIMIEDPIQLEEEDRLSNKFKENGMRQDQVCYQETSEESFKGNQ
jgi:hypothetical protein